MSDQTEPVIGEDGFDASASGEGGQVPMPSVAAESRGVAGGPEDQQVAEAAAGSDRRVPEGYGRPGEPHTD